MEGLCESYDEWRHWITVKAGIPLTVNFVEARIAALSNQRDPMTARFIELYGDPYRLRTIRWFEQARRELDGESKGTG